MVFTVPPWLAFTDSGPHLDRTRMLPMCKISERPSGMSQRVPSESGIRAMLDMLARRMALVEIFGDEEVPKMLVEASGGYPRDLLRLVREVLLAVMDTAKLPVDKDIQKTKATRAIAELRQQYSHALNKEDLPLLKTIAATNSSVGLGRDEKQRIAELFEHHFVLSYANGDRWLDLHPLVMSIREVEEYIASADKHRD